MTPTPEQLQQHYEDLADSALLTAAAELDSLIPEARGIVLQELALRRLAVPEQTAPPDDALGEAIDWVTVERFRDLSSAIVARGALEAADIPCFLRDENTVRLDWQISNFIGGMRLQVQQQDLEAANVVLHQSPTDAVETGDQTALEPEEHCPFCGSADLHSEERGFGLRAAALWFLTLPLPRGPRVWHCRTCGRHFTDEEATLDPGTPEPPAQKRKED